jgi:hypothetical protein
MAALDLRYAERQGEIPEEEWRAYLTERARIKARLESSLAIEPEAR